MNLHEFQAKEILARYGVPMPEGAVADTAGDAEAVARRLPGNRFAVKAQVHAGGRGRAGGVRLVESAADAGKAAGELLGETLITDQTGPEGRKVHQVYVEEAVEIARDVYIAVLVDRQAGKIALIGVEQGGEDIEERMAADPGIVKTLFLDPDGSASKGALEQFAGALGMTGPLVKKAATVFAGLGKAFAEQDAGLIEINPLAVTPSKELFALDVKMVLDDNAMFRHPEMRGLHDRDELDPVEMQAQANEINFVRMDGDIGVVVNGAGLALATHDMLTDAGGEPANFMDIRTTATSLDIAGGFDLLLANERVKAVLVNVHGGGMQRCDTIAEGIGIAMKRSGKSIPMVVRFAGNNADYGRSLLGNYGITFNEADSMAAAVHEVTAVAAGGAQ